MADSSTRKRCAAVATAAAVASLSLVARAQPAGDAAEAAKPIPRNPDGTISFAGTKDDVGNWEGPPGTSLANNVFEDALAPNRLNLPTNLSVDDVPFQRWARELYDQRQRSFTKDDPHTRCKPSGGARLFHTPYGFEILQLGVTTALEPEMKVAALWNRLQIALAAPIHDKRTGEPCVCRRGRCPGLRRLPCNRGRCLRPGRVQERLKRREVRQMRRRLRRV